MDAGPPIAEETGTFEPCGWYETSPWNAESVLSDVLVQARETRLPACDTIEEAEVQAFGHAWQFARLVFQRFPCARVQRAQDNVGKDTLDRFGEILSARRLERRRLEAFRKFFESMEDPDDTALAFAGELEYAYALKRRPGVRMPLKPFGESWIQRIGFFDRLLSLGGRIETRRLHRGYDREHFICLAVIGHLVSAASPIWFERLCRKAPTFIDTVMPRNLKSLPAPQCNPPPPRFFRASLPREFPIPEFTPCRVEPLQKLESLLANFHAALTLEYPERTRKLMEAQRNAPPTPRAFRIVKWALINHNWAYCDLVAALRPRLGLAGIAVEAYRIEHGVLPDSIEGLGAPKDPCTGNEFLYERIDEGYIITADTSVGPLALSPLFRDSYELRVGVPKPEDSILDDMPDLESWKNQGCYSPPSQTPARASRGRE